MYLTSIVALQSLAVSALHVKDEVDPNSAAAQPTAIKEKDFDYQVEIIWDDNEEIFKLKDYRYTDNLDMINDLKKRVKSSCKIRVERPSR